MRGKKEEAGYIRVLTDMGEGRGGEGLWRHA